MIWQLWTTDGVKNIYVNDEWINIVYIILIGEGVWDLPQQFLEFFNSFIIALSHFFSLKLLKKNVSWKK